MTSGLGRASADYFISWAAAELPTANEHYTEELALLPADRMHQYYEHNFEQSPHPPHERARRGCTALPPQRLRDAGRSCVSRPASDGALRSLNDGVAVAQRQARASE